MKNDKLEELCNMYENQGNALKVQVQKCKRKILAGRHRRRLKDTIKLDLN
jgi:hypothetical protein